MNEQRQYIAMGVISIGVTVGASVPLGVYMLLKDASNDVRLVLAGGLVFGLFAVTYRLIESRVQIAQQRAATYREAVQIARQLMGGEALPVEFES
jgi:ABC-type proline/glycine betaine transport system permease subunit